MPFLIRILAGLVLCAGCAAPAWAQDCQPPGSKEARAITLPLDTDEARAALSVSIELGLSPSTFPQEGIAGVDAPCKHSEFQVGAATYSLYGQTKAPTMHVPPRYAVAERNRERIAYLAWLPRPQPAEAAVRAHPKAARYQFTGDQFMYVLAVTEGFQRPFYRFYDTLPDDDTLAADMCAALSGQDRPIGIYNSVFNVTDFDPPPRKAAPSPCRSSAS